VVLHAILLRILHLFVRLSYYCLFSFFFLFYETATTEIYTLSLHDALPISSFRYLKQPDFDFKRFYHLLSDQGFVIYPGKLSDADSFRIGTIGHIFPEDVQALLVAIQRSLEEMRISRSQVVPEA